MSQPFLRRSRICRYSTSSPFRCSIHPLSFLIGNCPSGRAFLMPGETAWVHGGPASGMLRGAPPYATGGLEFKQSRLHLASRACGASRYIPSTLAARLPGSIPLCLSARGAISCPRRSYSLPPATSMAILHLPQRRTLLVGDPVVPLISRSVRRFPFGGSPVHDGRRKLGR
jgi:hypothetical protein